MPVSPEYRFGKIPEKKDFQVHRDPPYTRVSYRVGGVELRKSRLTPAQIARKVLAMTFLLGAASVGTIAMVQSCDSVAPVNTHLGEPVDGKGKPIQIETIPYGNYREIPVRGDFGLSDKSIIAWTKPGMSFEGKMVYGRTYPSGTTLGKDVLPDGVYGDWWEGELIPAYDKTADGLKPRLDEHGQQVKVHGKIAGHFAVPKDYLPKTSK